MLKIVLLLSAGILLVGCGKQPDKSPQYEAYIAKYGTSSRIFCQDGFLTKESWWRGYDDSPYQEVLTHDGDIPTRCGDASITVKETAKTGALSGSVY